MKKVLGTIFISMFILGAAGWGARIIYAEIYLASVRPYASLSVNPSKGSLDTIFTFDARNSTDSRGIKDQLEYKYNFNLGEYNSGEWSRNAVQTFKFSTPGKKQVILEVRDADGLTDKISTIVEVEEKSRFDGRLEAEPKQGDLDTQFRFEASVITNSSGRYGDYAVRWDFDGDNEWDTEFTNEFIVYHTYPNTGYKSPIVEIRSPWGETRKLVGYSNNDDEIGQVLVTSSGLPRAVLDVHPTVGYNDSEFYFDASRSYDREDRENIPVRFDFENDGIFDTEYSYEKQASHIYATPGIKRIVVEVKDSDGFTDRIVTSVLVRTRDLPPTDLRINVRQAQGLVDKGRGTVGSEFTFTASARDDRDNGNELRYRWDFDGDLKFDTVFSSSNRAIHRFTTTGEKNVVLEVKDTAGHIVSTKVPIEIVENTPPRAEIEVDYLVGTTATEFRFRSKSEDSQYRESALEYRWDFNSDGRYDTHFERSALKRHTFSTPGQKSVTLQVKDSEGAVATSSIEIQILSNTAPTARLVISPREGTFSTRFTFDASGSKDNQTSQDKLKYRFDFNYTGPDDIIYDGGFSLSEKKSVTLKDTVGKRTVRLEVMDENGEISTSFGEINIHWSSEYMEFLRRKSVMRGYRGGDMGPENYVTRAELVAMIVRAKRLSFSGIRWEDRYSDVSRQDWFWKYIFAAKKEGIAEGYGNGTFGPLNPVNRAEAVAIILRAFDDKTGYPGDAINFPDVPANVWYTDYVKRASVTGIVHGYMDGYFRPNNLMTRGEAAKVIALAMKNLERVK